MRRNAPTAPRTLDLGPMIDLTLVLLVLVMVNTPIPIDHMGISVPHGRSMHGARALTIGLYADGRTSLNRRVMSPESMLYELTRRLRPMAKKNVFIDAHADIEYGQVVDMVDLAREAGAAKVHLAKVMPDGPSPPTPGDPGCLGSVMPRGIFIGSSTVNAMPGAAMNEALADAAIQRLKDRIQGCYAEGLESQPNLSGSYMVDVAVGPGGTLLESPSIQGDSVGDLDLRDCIKAVLPALAYEPLGDQKSARIRYPILFSPG